MKKLVFLCLISILAVSCSVGDNDSGNNYYFEFLPIETADVPDTMVLNETYQINVTYYRPTICHSFNDFYFQKNGNERTVAVINRVIESDNCEDLADDLVEVSFNFVCLYSGSYVFKFWQGLDDNDNDLYYEVEVPVVE
ncbi:hypothetical protein RXV94_00425 [Yeosuana sp. MJ-SS3]|jgi:hypothetical protein|uniref:Lipoprotein n=1 Tax=Gilvirhabdus luticola TaxID=3079858 RepID=A0ABU3U2H0_9FLAO|nr:hypothetical protein [Yeosuana sp. MJ-SS3]MDU8884603.1 hypothetical protein [Yeosuana sp. MJ-SS3]